MIKVASETIQWDAISGSTSYDILINGVKKSSTKTGLRAQFALNDGDVVRVVAQPSGEWQEITFDYSVEVDTPPVVSGFNFGISPGTPYVPNLTTQYPDYIALDAACPRIGVGTGIPDGNSEAARAAGIKKWVVWAGNTGYMWSPAQAVAYCQHYPECIGIELGNELNLNASWTAQKIVDMQNPFFDAMKKAGFEDRVMLPSIGNNISSVEKLSMLDMCTKLHSLGIKFTIANYHNYGNNPVSADTWQECWTVGRHGTSCQIVFGHPPFAVTEFGDKIGWSDCPDASAQARAAAAWVNHLAVQPNFFAGHWFLKDDGSAWSGFGLRDSSGNKRPSYTAYRDAIAGRVSTHTMNAVRAMTPNMHESMGRPTSEELAEFGAMKQAHSIRHAALVSR